MHKLLRILNLFCLVVASHGSIFEGMHNSRETVDFATVPNGKADVIYTTTDVNESTGFTTLHGDLASDVDSGNVSVNINRNAHSDMNDSAPINLLYMQSKNNPHDESSMNSAEFSSAYLKGSLYRNTKNNVTSTRNPIFRYVFGYMYVENVNCSACLDNKTCFTQKNVSHVDAVAELFSRTDNASTNDAIGNKISELSDMEDLLYDLYNDVILASITFACKLDEKEGSYALKLSKMYVERRSIFNDKMTQLLKLVNEPITSSAQYFEDNSRIPDMILYEKNLNFTKNVTILLELVANILSSEIDIEKGKECMNKVADHTKSYPDISLLTKTVRKLRQLEEIYNTTLSNIGTFNSIIASNKMLANIFNTSAVSELTNLEKWTKVLVNTTVETDIWMLHLDSKKSVAVFYESAEIIILGVFFVIGIAGNGLLLIIFIRHREIRANSNIMLMNIAIADIIFLFSNIPVVYSDGNFLDDVLCKAYHYICMVCISVNVYSLVLISIQRFFVLSVFFKRGGCLRNKSNSVLIISIWIIGFLVAIPYIFLAGVEDDDSCYDIKYKEVKYRVATTLFDVIVLCILPVSCITLFGGLTVDALENGIYNEEVKAKAQNKLKKVGVLTSDVLIALSCVFAISYLPFYMFRFAFVWSDTKVDILHYEYILFIMPYLVYMNSCLNPIALYVASKRYRSYFKLYLLCGREEASIDIGNTPPVTTSTTTVESNL